MDNKTDAELQADIDAALAVDLTPQPEEAPEVVEPIIEEEPTIEEEIEENPQKEEIKEEKPQDTRTVPIKRYADSTREAQVIAFTKKEFENQIEEVSNLPVPTEQELKVEYPDWDLMSSTEQKLATKLMHSEKKEAKINEITNKQKESENKIVERALEADTFAVDPDILKKFPKIEGRQEEFKIFATKQTRLTLDLEDAAALFSTTLPEPTKNKGQMFETGTGGEGKDKPKSDKISLDEARLLMQTDYNKYKEMLLAGKIEMDV